MKTIASIIREKQLNPVIQNRGLVYESEIRNNVQNYQLAKFNRLWADIQRHIPYYQGMVRDGIVRGEINSWEDFTRFPILSRISIQKDVTKYIDHSHRIAGWSVTGGSTGTPIRIPYWSSIHKTVMPLAWLGRRFYHIQVSDRMFHLWGHSHLFGNGLQRYVKQFQRNLKNRLLGYQVFSAYHLTPQRLRLAGKAVIKMRPDFIVGYSRSLTLLARENEDLASSFQQLPIKAIIATTEAFNQPGDAEYIEQIFGCPVGMEYGTAETGVIAYTHPSDQRYRAFWDDYLLEAAPIDGTNTKLLLTTLYPSAMPLIRYDIGDNVCDYERDKHSITSFGMVYGRDNDLIELNGRGYIHPVALMHCFQSQKGVLGIQCVQELDNSVSIDVLCEVALPEDDELTVRRNLATLDPLLSQCKFTYVNNLENTLAGKTKWVIKR